jgi:hypothetical protein|tara:strand:- start:719 stop:856 length:138 start_codon:yes stop_codon:yes gene_type:complete
MFAFEIPPDFGRDKLFLSFFEGGILLILILMNRITNKKTKALTTF